MADISDQAVQSERALLGGLILEPDRWNDDALNSLSVDHFVLSDHRQIWRTLNTLHSNGVPVDLAALISALDGKVDASYFIDLMNFGTVSPCVP